MMNNIDRVKELGYSFENSDRVGVISIVKPTGEKIAHNFSRDLVRTIKFGAERIEVTEKELFDSVYDLSEEEMCQFQHGCSLRSYNYIKAVRSNIGLVGVGFVSDLFGSKEQMNFGEKSDYSHTEVHVDIDDAMEGNYYFNHHPSAQDIKTAIAIWRIESDFRSHLRKETFKCWECGHVAHWLDVPGNLFEKINALDEKYCGC